MLFVPMKLALKERNDLYQFGQLKYNSVWIEGWCNF